MNSLIAGGILVMKRQWVPPAVRPKSTGVGYNLCGVLGHNWKKGVLFGDVSCTTVQHTTKYYMLLAGKPANLDLLHKVHVVMHPTRTCGAPYPSFHIVLTLSSTVMYDVG